jgi:plastocyanin
MIWRSVTCFSLGIFLAMATAHAASVSGTVSLRDSRVDAVNKHRDYSGIVISLVPVNRTVTLPTPKHATMTQKSKMFMPHLLPVLAGTTVDFPNFDPIFHNAFSSYNGQIFDVGLYPPGSTKSVRFTRAGVVRVFCNIHPAMSALILVLSTPYFTATALMT